MLLLEIAGWFVVGATVGYFVLDMKRVHRLSVMSAMIIGMVGATAGGLLGHAASGQPFFEEGTANLSSILGAVVGAFLITFVAMVYRRFRPAHTRPVDQHAG
jgi:uncharacterized membrane protein YeaQ/YmgE (transglycosylase-associated protein family)